MAYFRCGAGSGGETVTPFVDLNRVSYNPSGIYDTDYVTTLFTHTASQAETWVTSSDSRAYTNCGSNDGYISIEKNGTSVYKEYITSATSHSLSDNHLNMNNVPDIPLSTNDVVTVKYGFDNYHTNVWLDLYINFGTK